MIISIISFVLAIVSIVYSCHVAIVYQRFNDQIKSWSEKLDALTKDAIFRSARQILREFDEKLTEQKDLERQGLENDEDV